MESASPEWINPYRPMPALDELKRPLADARTPKRSSRPTSAHDPHRLTNKSDVGQELYNDPTVEIDGQLALDGGWMLRKYVNPREGDTITIHLERQRVAATIEVDEVEEQVTLKENLPHYKGWVWIPDSGEDHVAAEETLSVREIRARDRQRSRDTRGPPKTVKDSQAKRGSNSVRPAEGPPQEVTRRLSIVPESPEGPKIRVSAPLEEIPLLSGHGNQFTVRDDSTAQTQGPPRTASGARRPTHPSSIAQNIAGLGAPRRPMQFMDGLGEEIRRQSAAAREAREAAQGLDGPEAAAFSAQSNKRKSPDIVTNQKRPRRSRASEILSDHIQEGNDEVDEAEVPTPPVVKEKKKGGRPKKNSEAGSEP